MQPVTIPLADGARAWHLPDDRFKTSRLTAALLLPLREETASAYAVLPFLLRRGCAAYPDFSAFHRRLDELYGARVNADVTRVGEAQALVLDIVSIDDRYTLSGEEVAARCARLLYQMLFEPALEDGVFPGAALEQEKRCLIELIEAEVNNKRLYARHRCERMVCRGEAYAVSRYGDAARVAALTPWEVTQAWKRMLREARIQLIVQSGSKSAAQAFREGLGRIGGRAPADCRPATAFDPRAEVQRETQRMAVNQAKLVMGYRIGITEPDGDVPAARLMNTLLGGTPSSLLFRNVREKQSLCYYCASTYDRIKGVLLVDSGVEESKAAQAEEEIRRQMEALRQGAFSDEDLEAARRALVNQLLSAGDLQSSLASWYMGQSLQENAAAPEQAAEAVEAVTRERVTQAAQAMAEDSVYLLASEQTPEEWRAEDKKEKGV